MNSNLTKLKVIFFGLAVGQIILAVLAISFRITGENAFDDPGSRTMFLGIFYAMAAALAGGSILLPRRRIESIKQEPDGFIRSNAYMAACIVRFALREGASLAGAAGYFFTGREEFILLFFVCFLLFLVSYPSNSLIEKELGSGFGDTE